MSWSRALLLDPNAAIFLAAGTLPTKVVDRVVFAGLADGVFVSPVTGWEIGLLARPRSNGRPGLTFRPDPRAWFAALLAKPIIKLAPLTPTAAIASSDLPAPFHDDPADRLLVATAREMSVPLVTRDLDIRAYAQAGHLEVLPC